MKIGIAKAYNGQHNLYKKFAQELNLKTFLFNIDTSEWLDNLDKADAYLWHADNKEHDYRMIHDRVYFIEKILKKPIFPDMNMYFAFGDKIKETDILNYYKIPSPKTYITYDRETAIRTIEKIKYPFILKDAHGYGGLHVKKVDNKKEARVLVEKIFSNKGLRQGNPKSPTIMKDYLLAQEFLAVDRDLRVIVIGDKVVCAYWREADGDWKHNVSGGGKASFDNIPPKALQMCLELNKKMGFHWMSYDVFVLKDGSPLMNEFSCNFGIKAPTEAGYQIRKIQIEYIKKYLNKYGKNKK